ncbi:MAG: SAM-dependent methyltransferase, partial [Sphingomicrobium sp.]
MALIDNLLGKLIRKGTLTVVMPDGKSRAFGPGDGPALTVHLADRTTAFAIARNPRLGLGEAYMDG